jgi:CheY-like chemotaxis protein
MADPVKNILIVEDDPFTQDFYNFLLKRAGYNVIIMEDGDSIIKELESDDINLVIMDVSLKNSSINGEKINGIHLTRYIKQNISKYIPVLLITAYSPDIKLSKFLEESLAEDYIIKPITDFNSLLHKIHTLIL